MFFFWFLFSLPQSKWKITAECQAHLRASSVSVFLFRSFSFKQAAAQVWTNIFHSCWLLIRPVNTLRRKENLTKILLTNVICCIILAVLLLIHWKTVLIHSFILFFNCYCQLNLPRASQRCFSPISWHSRKISRTCIRISNYQLPRTYQTIFPSFILSSHGSTSISSSLFHLLAQGRLPLH